MIFIALCIALALVAVACALVELRRGAGRALPSLPLVGLIASCVLVMVGLVHYSAPGKLGPFAGAPAHGEADAAVDWFATGAVLACLSAVALIFGGWRQKARASLALPGMGLLIGVYLLFVVGNQIWFFRAGPGRAGQVDPAWLNGLVPPTQRCALGPIAIRGVGTARVTYRCPAPTSLVFGQDTPAPFAPWPGYRQAVSTTVARAARLWLAERHRAGHRRVFVFTDH